jgi:uncharacterized RDD family membrane protein YckC
MLPIKYMIETKVKTETRLISWVADLMIMSIPFIILSIIPSKINDQINQLNSKYHPFASNEFTDMVFYMSLLGFSMYFCKDSINGQSIAKFFFKLKVVDNKTGKSASPLQCLVRNIFCIIWPIEAIVTLINTNGRRIGDIVAGTRVVYHDSRAINFQTNYLKVGFTFLLSYLGLLILAILTKS